MVKTWLIKIRAVCMCQLFASCFVRRRSVEPIRVMKIGITRLTHVHVHVHVHVLWKCFMCPHNVNILKNKINIHVGIYEWEYKLDA